jgi:hypothetical protein
VVRSKLTVRVRTPTGPAPVVAEARVLVDGQDMVATWFPEGFGEDPDVLLGAQGPLQATMSPRRVMIGLPECEPGCCGSLEVRIRRDGDDVVWDRWATPYVDRASAGEIRFDASDYAAELDRADRERGWEWSGRTVVRLARRLFAEDPALLARFGCGPEFVISWPTPDADSVRVHIPAPPDQIFDTPHSADVLFRFDDRAPGAQAADLLAGMAEAAGVRRGEGLNE